MNDSVDLFDDTFEVSEENALDSHSLARPSVSAQNRFEKIVVDDQIAGPSNVNSVLPCRTESITGYCSDKDLFDDDTDDDAVMENMDLDVFDLPSCSRMTDTRTESGVPMEMATSSVTVVNEDSNDSLQPPCPKRRSLTIEQIRTAGGIDFNDPKNPIKTFGDYMNLKKRKLDYQINYGSNLEKKSDIFNGISIFVNGYTNPPALELRYLIQENGGHYHLYYAYGRTTFTVATQLAEAKKKKLRANESYIRPEWIVDCIKAGELLDDTPYILFGTPRSIELARIRRERYLREHGEEVNEYDGLSRNIEDVVLPPRPSTRRLDARDPNFLAEYYANSRLHLISTMAQEMRDYVHNLRIDGRKEFPYKEELKTEVEDIGERPPPGHIIFHVDLDCFFVSVAVRHRPELVDKPIAVTHSRGGNQERGGFAEIASCSYKARAAGLKNGMLMRDAQALCPELVCVPYEFEEYRTVSKAIYDIMTQYTLEIRAVSCDEMYVQVAPILRELGHGNAIGVAEHMRKKIKELTGCPASVGIGPNQLIARLATRHAKPNGVFFVPSLRVPEFIAKEKIENLPGVGSSVLAKLERNFSPVELCSHIHLATRQYLGKILGPGIGQQILSKCGSQFNYHTHYSTQAAATTTISSIFVTSRRLSSAPSSFRSLYRMCRGEDDVEGLSENPLRKSVSCDINYGIRFTEMDEVITFLGAIGAELERKLTSARVKAGNLSLKLLIRCPDAPLEPKKYLGCGKCDPVTKSALLKPLTQRASVITEQAVKLMLAINPVVTDLRGISVHLTRLESLTGILRRPEGIQKHVLEDMFKSTKLKKAEKKEKERQEQLEHERLRREQQMDILSQALQDQYPMDMPTPTESQIEKLEEARKIREQRKEEYVPQPLPRHPSETHPRFFTASLSALRMNLMELCLMEPCEADVRTICDYVNALIRYGELPRLKKFMMMFASVAQSDEVPYLWNEGGRYICDLADQYLIEHMGAPMFCGKLWKIESVEYFSPDFDALWPLKLRTMPEIPETTPKRRRHRLTPSGRIRRPRREEPQSQSSSCSSDEWRPVDMIL